MDTDVKHPHFDKVEAATECYRSKATGMYFVLQQRGSAPGEAEEVVALPAMYDGSLLPVHAEPFAWGPDVWDCLDAIHARR